ncbi:MAG TPA: dodecin family protein [Chondromyces sp.]|nr:dodecin family protein [Chondromyces sp.]
MSVAKVIEISAESDTSFEDAIKKGIQRAGTTVKDIRGAWVKEQEVTVDNGAVQLYRVKMKVTFALKS